MSRALHHKINYNLVLITAFLLPWGKLLPVMIVFLLLSSLLEGRFLERWKQLEHKTLLSPALGFYIIYAIGMIYTANRTSGWFDLEVKLPLLLFPLVFSTITFDKPEQIKIFNAFVYGCVGIALFLFVAALYDHYTASVNSFFYENFARWLHPSYLAMYLNLALCVIVERIFSGKPIINGYVSAGILLFLSFIVFLLSSKMGILCTTLVFVGALVVLIFKKKRLLLGLGGIVLIALSLFITLNYVPEIGARLLAMKTAMISDADKTNPESNNVRKLIWQTDMEVIGRNLFQGVGTGDVKDVLLDAYIEKGVSGAYELDEEGKPVHILNAHNQFLQTFIAVGIVGFLVLLAMVILPAIIHKTFLPIVFSTIITLNFLTESVLEREYGIMFFAFFLSLFLSSRSKD